MARPRKELPPAATRRITIRLTEDLYEAICTDAKTARLPVAEYVRQLITDKHPVLHQEIVFDSEELLKVFQDLGHCSGNLNQIARYLNQGGTMTNFIWKDVRECISELYEMRDQLKRIAGEYRGNH